MIPHKAIYKLYPTVRTIYGEWDARDQEGNPVDIDQDLVSAWVDPEAYKDQRFAEYPSIADQLDRLYHEGYDGWRASIQAIKDKYPKE